MSSLRFLSADKTEISAEEWLTEWSAKYDKYQNLYPEALYAYLRDKSKDLTEQDLRILGMWKDGALARGQDFSNGIDPTQVKCTGRWSPTAASVAFEVWSAAAAELGGRLREHQLDPLDFLSAWSVETGTRSNKKFGLSRATTLLHFISGGTYPIYDSRVRRAAGKLTSDRTSNSPKWYLDEFCPLFKRLAEACKAETGRKLDKALFCYGGRLGKGLVV